MLNVNSGTAETVSPAPQNMFSIMCLWLANNCLLLNLIKCSSVIIAPSKQNGAAASIVSTCKLLVYGSAIITGSITITIDFGWHAKSKQFTLKLFLSYQYCKKSGILNKRTQA